MPKIPIGKLQAFGNAKKGPALDKKGGGAPPDDDGADDKADKGGDDKADKALDHGKLKSEFPMLVEKLDAVTKAHKEDDQDALDTAVDALVEYAGKGGDDKADDKGGDDKGGGKPFGGGDNKAPPFGKK